MSFASVFTRFHPALAVPRPAQRARGGRQAWMLCAWAAGAALAVFLPGRASAQAPGTQDTNFVSSGLGSTIYTIVDQFVDETETFFIGGDATLEDRLLLDGGIDAHFEFADFGNGGRIVYTAAAQTLTGDLDQDKLLIGGLFGKTPKPSGEPGTAPAQNVLRLNSNGTLDTTFDPGAGANDYVTVVLPESDQSIYVGGNFDHFNKLERHHVVRLNVDGSLDSGFDSSLNINDSVLNLADQIDPATGLPNGQILVAGSFNRVDGQPPAKLARLNSDGSLDTSFVPVIDTRVLTVAVQPDGKIIIGGNFGLVDGTSVQNLARLNQDGSLDPTFSASVSTSPPGSPVPTAVYVLKLLPDGRLYVGGNFFSVNGVTRQYFARLLADGSVDASFDPGAAIINSVQSLAVQANNEIVIGETVSQKIDNVFPNSLIRLYGDPVPTVTPAVVPPVISLTASKPAAKETSTTGTPKRGQFRLHREASDVSNALGVFVRLGGTATLTTDYTAQALQPFDGNIYRVTFPAGASDVKIGIRPTGDELEDSPETITLKVKPPQNTVTSYTIGSPRKAKVTLTND